MRQRTSGMLEEYLSSEVILTCIEHCDLSERLDVAISTLIIKPATKRVS
jgi:hypothetical protein